MCSWEAEIECIEVMARENTLIDTTDIVKDVVRERRQFESAMEYLLSIQPQQKESK